MNNDKVSRSGIQKDRSLNQDSVFFRCLNHDGLLIKLAGIRVRVLTPSMEKMLPDLLPYAADSVTNGNEGDIDVTELKVNVSAGDIDRVRTMMTDLISQMGRTPDSLSTYVYEQTALRHKVLRELIWHRVFYLHGSALMMEGRGYLFMGMSGAGKSTHARIWRECFGDAVTMINDDKPLIRFEGKQVIVCGSPWNGKHKIGTNTEAPLKAIVQIVKDTDNRITSMDLTEAFHLLYIGTLRFEEKAQMKILMELLGGVIETIPFYCLHCNMEHEAAELAYEVLKEAK